jgi:hypothetical protein
MVEDLGEGKCSALGGIFKKYQSCRLGTQKRKYRMGRRSK